MTFSLLSSPFPACYWISSSRCLCHPVDFAGSRSRRVLTRGSIDPFPPSHWVMTAYVTSSPPYFALRSTPKLIFPSMLTLMRLNRDFDRGDQLFVPPFIVCASVHPRTFRGRRDPTTRNPVIFNLHVCAFSVSPPGRLQTHCPVFHCPLRRPILALPPSCLDGRFPPGQTAPRPRALPRADSLYGCR